MPSPRAIPVLALAAALAAAIEPAHAQTRPSTPLSSAQDPAPTQPTPTQPTPDPATLFAQATTALQANNLPTAEALFRQVAQLDPTAAAPWINLGVTEMREAHWTDARASLEHARSLTPPQARPQLAGIALNLGLIHYRTADYPAAAADLREAVALAPASAQARYLLGLACFFSDDFPGTLAALQPLWPTQSTNLRYLYVLASAAGRQHQTDLEQQALARMSTVGAGTAELHLYLGKAMLTKGDAPAALPELQQAVALDPHLPLAHFFLAEALHQQHQDPAAVAALHTEIALEPELAFPYDELGTLDDLLGDTPGATAAFHAALDRDPALSSSLLGLAAIDRRQGQLPEALTLLTRAEALRPGSGSIHFLRAQLLRQLGQNTEARTEFAEAATLLHQVNDNLQRTDSAAQQADATQAAAGAQL